MKLIALGKDEKILINPDRIVLIKKYDGYSQQGYKSTVVMQANQYIYSLLDLNELADVILEMEKK